METTQPKTRRKGLTFPLILIALGTTFLLVRNGLVDVHLLWQWMPLVPIAIGCSLLVKRMGNKAE